MCLQVWCDEEDIWWGGTIEINSRVETQGHTDLCFNIPGKLTNQKPCTAYV